MMKFTLLAISWMIILVTFLLLGRYSNSSNVITQSQDVPLSSINEIPMFPQSPNPSDFLKSFSQLDENGYISSDGNAVPSGNGVTYWLYPNTTILHQSHTTLELESTDDPETVTSWYANKFASQNLELKTVVKTNTDDHVQNRLRSANENGLVSVDINRSQNSSKTTIKVTVISVSSVNNDNKV